MKINKFLSKTLELLLDLYAPPLCPGCSTVMDIFNRGVLCIDCRKKFDDEFLYLCPSCKKPSDSCYCLPEFKIGKTRKVVRLNCVGYYTGFNEDNLPTVMIFRLKHFLDNSIPIFYAKLLSDIVSDIIANNSLSVDDTIITFMPRTKSAFLKYEFDHMELTAKYLAKSLNLKMKPLLKNKSTVSQKTLSQTKRQENAQKSITLRRNTEKYLTKHTPNIILIDDVVTTGSSMKAAIKELSKNGIKNIFPVSILYTDA